MVTYSMMNSEAWQHLPGVAVKLLLHLIKMSKGDNGAGSPRGELFLSERDAAAAIDTARNTASTALATLIKHGFIRPVERGSFKVKAGERELRATVWRLTFQHYPKGKMGPTNDWQHYKHEKKSRAQKLNGSGSKIEPLPSEVANLGANIEPAISPPRETAKKSRRSIIDPHLDMPGAAGSIRERVASAWPSLNRSARNALATAANITSDQLGQFVGGSLDLNIKQQRALKGAIQEAA